MHFYDTVSYKDKLIDIYLSRNLNNTCYYLMSIYSFFCKEDDFFSEYINKDFYNIHSGETRFAFSLNFEIGQHEQRVHRDVMEQFVEDVSDQLMKLENYQSSIKKMEKINKSKASTTYQLDFSIFAAATLLPIRKSMIKQTLKPKAFVEAHHFTNLFQMYLFQ